jgi:hypothetical protein
MGIEQYALAGAPAANERPRVVCLTLNCTVAVAFRAHLRAYRLRADTRQAEIGMFPTDARQWSPAVNSSEMRMALPQAIVGEGGCIV